MQTSTTQNLFVFQDGHTYKAVTELTHEIVCASEKANKAIQHAVDALAEADGKVTLGRGVFPLDAPVALADDVWLCGSGRGTKLRVSQANEAGIGIACQGHQGVVISDLAITAGDNERAETGVLLDGCGNCQVRDVFCAGFGQYGIWVRNSAFLCEIRGCTLAGNGQANLYLDHLERGRYGDYIPNLVTHCTVYGGGKGIACNRTIVLNVVACAVYQTRDVAYHVANTSNSVLISGCRSFQIGSHAVVVENAHEFNLSSNIFCWHTGHGVVVQDCYWGTISGNEIIDTGSYNPGGPNFRTQFSELPADVPLFNGINLLRARGYNVTGNTIFNWAVAPKIGIGIWEDRESYHNVITGNNINYYQDADVRSEGRNSVAANNVGYAERPYNDEAGTETRVQSFQVELTERFIAGQIGK